MNETRATSAGTVATSIGRMSKKRNAVLERSSSVSLASSSRERGPASAKPTRSVVTGRTATPRSGRWSSNQRMWKCSATLEPTIMKHSAPRRATVKSPISLPLRASIGVSATRPSAGRRPASIRFSQGSARLPVISYLP